MWEHHLLSVEKGGHLRGTLDTWPFEEEVQHLIWVDAMVEEYESIVRNNVWDVVARPESKSIVSSHWLYKLILSYKEDLARELEMKDMGLMHYFLGMEVWQTDGELFVSQRKYANEILRRFHMEKCKPMQTPLAGNWRKEDATSREVVEATVYRQLVGSLMYLVNTGPYLCYAVNQLSQAMVQPTKMFWKATKHVLRYLRGTYQYGLWYRRTKGVKLQGFTDADWAGSPSDRKSTSGGIFSLGSMILSLYSKKQKSVALNLAEVEYKIAS
eukprot:PITA_16244